MDVAFACFDQHDRTTNAPAAAATQRSTAAPQARPAAAPIRSVLWWSTPDSRHSFYKDLHLDCGHVLVNRPMRKGEDGKFHVAKRVRCTCCAQGVPAKPKRLPGFVAPTQAAEPTQPASVPRQLDTVTVGETASPAQPPHRPFKITTAWSPRDLAARNWE